MTKISLRQTLSSLIIVGFFGFNACVSHDIKPTLCTSTTTISFEEKVEPVVTTICAKSGCHNGDNGASRDWTDFNKLQAHAAEVKRRINLPKSDSDHMPKSGELTETQIQDITCWVEQGALNN